MPSIQVIAASRIVSQIYLSLLDALLQTRDRSVGYGFSVIIRGVVERNAWRLIFGLCLCGMDQERCQSRQNEEEASTRGNEVSVACILMPPPPTRRYVERP